MPGISAGWFRTAVAVSDKWGRGRRGGGPGAGFAEADEEGDLCQLQRRVAQVMQHQLVAGLVEQPAERQAGLAQAPLQGARAEVEALRQALQVGTLLRQLARQFAAGAVEYAVALVELAEQTVGVGVEQPAQLGVGLGQRRGQQAPGEDQGVVGLAEQHRAAEDAPVLGSIGGRRMLEAHLGRRDLQAGDPAAEGQPAGQGLLAVLALLLAHQRLPAVRHLRFEPFAGRFVGQVDPAEVAHQGGVAGLAVQGIGQGRTAHDQVAEYAVVAGAHGLAQVQAEVLVAGQPHALGEQLQVGADGDALVALGEDGRAQVHPGQQRFAGEALAGEMVQQALQANVREARRAGDILQRMRGYMSNAPSELQRVDLAALVAQALLLLDGAARQEHIELAWQPPGQPWLVRADPVALEQVLHNLVRNAFDALKDCGREQGRVEITLRQHGGEAELRVRDNGPGIEPAVAQRIFEPFFTTKAPGKGTGLGLPMVKLFVDNSGGFIDIRSRPREGTTVALHFPHSRVSTAEARATDAPYQLGSESVLVIEDDAEVRETVAHTLNILGYNIVAAVNPEHAWELLQDGLRIDLIISDIKMPGNMTVIDFLRRLEQQGLDIPVIFATGYSADVLVQESLVEGRYPVMFKPFSLQEMSHQVRSVLGVLSPEQE